MRSDCSATMLPRILRTKSRCISAPPARWSRYDRVRSLSVRARFVRQGWLGVINCALSGFLTHAKKQKELQQVGMSSGRTLPVGFAGHGLINALLV